MTLTIILSAVFLVLGFFIGKLLSSNQAGATLAQKEEQIRQINLQLEQMQQQVKNVTAEKEQFRNEREAVAMQLTKKEVDFDNLLERNKEYRQESNRCKKNSPKNLNCWRIKY